MVSVAPQKHFVERLGADRVTVTVMVPPGASPATWEPKPSQMAELARTDLYLAVGVPFERVWLPRLKTANPDLTIVATQRGVPLRAMAGRNRVRRDIHHDGHGNDEGHPHAGGQPDPHIWLSPPLVLIQAANIRDALIKADPAGEADYRAALRAFRQEVEDLDAEIRLGLSGHRPGRKVLVFHPAWGYFCDAYGLTQVAMEREGKEPTAAGLARLIRQARAEGTKVVFVQPQFSQRSAAALAEAINGRVQVLDPLSGDWAANLLRAARALAGADQ